MCSGRHSNLTFIYDIELDEWINGPQLLEGRNCHSSCALKSIDGTIDTIVIVGGYTESSNISSSTELFIVKENRWTRGPNLPVVVNRASFVALPNHTSYSCLLIGGCSKEGNKYNLSDSIYALDNELKSWALVGHLKEARYGHTITII